MSIMGLSCIFPVPNIKKTAEFYVSKLEFCAVEYLECKLKLFYYNQIRIWYKNY